MTDTEYSRRWFWKGRGAWPADVYGQVFLGRAVERLGAALFGDEWTGDEPSADPEKDKDAVGRFSLARQHLNIALRDGALPFSLLPLAGGNFYQKPCNMTWWNVPSSTLRERWDRCQMDPKKPLAGTWFDNCWIFVDGAALAKLTDAAEEKSRPDRSLRLRKKFHDLLKTAVETSPDQNPKNTRDEWERIARENHRLPRDVFDEVWKAAMESVPGNAWTRPGRRRKGP